MAEFMLKIGTTKIDYDPEKDRENRKSHGYALDAAARILERVLLFQPGHCIVSDPFEEHGEERYMVMGEHKGRVVLFACTLRDNGDTIRVMSMRPASRKERKKFQRTTGTST